MNGIKRSARVRVVSRDSRNSIENLKSTKSRFKKMEARDKGGRGHQRGEGQFTLRMLELRCH